MSNFSIIFDEETEMVEIKSDDGYYWNANDWDWSWGDLTELLRHLGHNVVSETIPFEPNEDDE